VQIAALAPSVSIHTHADSTADAFGASSDADSTTQLGGMTLVQLRPISGAGQQLVGNTAVWIRSEYQDLRLSSDANGACHCFAGEAGAHANLRANEIAKVAGEDESFIKTADLTVDANQYINQFDGGDGDAHGGAFVDHNGGGDVDQN